VNHTLLTFGLTFVLVGCPRPPVGPSRARVAQELVLAQETALSQCTAAFLPEGLYWDCQSAAHNASPYIDRADITPTPCTFRDAARALQAVVDILHGYAVPVEESLSVTVLEADILGKECQ
jgi:hypothetical protein